MFDTIIIGAGAAGIFSAINIKTHKDIKVLILEKSLLPLKKVSLSGGGRCNVTNANFDVLDFCKNYPRGSKELKSAFSKFSSKDVIGFLEDRGVDLKVEQNNKVYPKSNSSQTIIDCFIKEIKANAIEIRYNQNILKILKKENLFEIYLKDGQILFSKNLILATGSSQQGLKFAKDLGHSVDDFIPSLFSFNIEKNDILALAGSSKENVIASLDVNQKKYFHSGDILITHRGFSGPVIINLSSKVAKYLHENNYKANLKINWLGNKNQDEVYQHLLSLKSKYLQKSLVSINPFKFSKRLWEYFLRSCNEAFFKPLNHVAKKDLLKLSVKLCNDRYKVVSKSLNKSEFVSCGGVHLKEIDFKSMESRVCKNLYIVGELLNIDGITGGFNLQNAFTTGFIASQSL